MEDSKNPFDTEWQCIPSYWSQFCQLVNTRKLTKKVAKRDMAGSQATRFVCHVIVKQDKLGKSQLDAFSLTDLIYPFIPGGESTETTVL